MSNWRRPRPKQSARFRNRIAFVGIGVAVAGYGALVIYQLFVLNQAPVNIPRFGIASFFLGLLMIVIGLWKYE